MAPGDGRYRIVRPLGRGGMGAVFLAHDSVRAEEVALKRVLAAEGASRVRFKREFRGVERLAHPNLIRVFELDEDETGPFFTMEVVHGVDLSAWCSGTRAAVADADTVDALASDPYAQTAAAPGTSASGPRRDPAASARIEEVLPQILDALSFLHRNGVVHRDLKPSNVLVDRDGVVKLVDFGILAELGAREGDRDTCGTPGYMAPEQLLGMEARPENDLYALGVMLFELYTGRLPFEGNAISMMRATVEEAPPRLADLAPDEPLARVIDALLAKDPHERPSLADIARALPNGVSSLQPSSAARRTTLEGRFAERRGLEDLLAEVRSGAFRVAALVGPSGAGKSTLARWLDERATAAELAVLHGRGRPNERVAFNAVDGVVDGVALWLSRTQPESELLELAHRASAAFPALSLAGRKPPAIPRHAAFDAVIALLARVAERGLLVVVDDLQWADADSLAFLRHLFDAPPKGVLLLATMRDDVRADDARALIDEAHATVHTLGALETDALRALASDAIERWGGDPTDEMIARVVDAADGRPFLAELAARLLTSGAASVARSLPDAVAALLSDVDDGRRKLLAALVARDGAADVEELSRVVGGSPGSVDDALRSLEREGLVRRLRGPRLLHPADLYHDAVRLGVAAALGEQAIVDAHARYADVLGEDTPAIRRVRHILGAGRVADAARLAVEAAAEAAAQRAFGLEAEMWSIALREPANDRERLVALRARADALSQIGRYRDAAEDFHAIAEASTGEVALDAAIRETHALLAAHEIRAGRARAAAIAGTSVLARLAVLASAIAFLVGPLRAARTVGRSGKEKSAAVDREVQLGMLLTYFDPLSGLDRLQRARTRAVAISAAEHAAWCDNVFAYYAYFGTVRRGRSGLAERYRARAAAVLGSAPPSEPALLAFPSFLDGIACKREGRWAEARVHLDRAAAAIEGVGQLGTFEHMMVLVHRVQVDWYEQDLHAMGLSLARFRLAARQAEDSALRCHLDYLEVSHALFRGELARATSEAERVRKQWPDDIPTLQRFVLDLALALVDVVGGDPVAGRRLVARAMKRDARFRPMKSMYAGQFATIAALIEAQALARGDREASARRVFAYAKRTVHAPPFGTAAVERAVASAWLTLGRPDRALTALEYAEARARAQGQRVDEALAVHARGVLLGGDEGAALRARATARVDELGASPRLFETFEAQRR